MGHKTHPIGFRLGIIKDWQATWFAGKQGDYRDLVREDLAIRKNIADQYPDAGISRLEIERSSSEVVVTVHTARPGIVIGRGGKRVEELRRLLETLTNRRARLNVQENASRSWTPSSSQGASPTSWSGASPTEGPYARRWAGPCRRAPRA